MPNVPVKRLNYFNHQFLEADDFEDEQRYHVEMRRLHNQHLHTWGIASGLNVEFKPGATAVTVRSGVAVDRQGCEIVLRDDVLVELADAQGDEVFLTIAYREQETDPSTATGAQGNTRWSEEPEIEPWTKHPPEDQILLAKVTRKGGKVSAVDESGRQAAGVVAGGALRVSALLFSDSKVDESAWVRMRLSAPNRAELTGALGRLTIEDAAVPLVLRQSGAKPEAGGLWRLAFGSGNLNFEVNTAPAGDFTAVENPLLVSRGGQIHVRGPQASLSFGSRAASGEASKWVANPSKGERWVWYADGGNARLWSGSDKLSVQADGKVAIGGAPSAGRLTIEDAAAPLVLRKTGAAEDGGGLWRLALDGGNLRFDSNAAKAGDFGSLKMPLRIWPDGQIHIEGEYAGLSLGDREVTAYVANPSKGERWVWYAEEGNARLWSGSDKLSVQADGNVSIEGNISAGGDVSGKQMKLVSDHPLEATKDLVHAAIEAPELVVCFRGEGDLSKGNTIELPAYFEKLTRKENRTVLLTHKSESNQHGWPLAASSIVDGKFTVSMVVHRGVQYELPNAEHPLPFYWEVKAVRADVPELEVEPDKQS